MFESLKLLKFKEEATEECEECLAKDFLVDAIIDGRQKRICQRCVIANNAIVLKKPLATQQEKIDRPSVRDVMFRASGIMPKPLQTSTTAKVEDLRSRYEELKKKREALQREKEFLAQKERQSTEWQDKKEKFEVLDEREFINYMESLPQETKETTEIKAETKTEEAKEKAKEILDFSPEATKRTRIRDLLEMMKKMDEEIKAKETEKAVEKEKEEEA